MRLASRIAVAMLATAAFIAPTVVDAKPPRKLSVWIIGPDRPSQPYKRVPTTRQQRQDARPGQCVDCGAVTGRNHADHKRPMIKEYFSGGGTINPSAARAPDATQSQCPTCSNRQGGVLSGVARRIRQQLEENPPRQPGPCPGLAWLKGRNKC
jgi:hypothetical protein